MIKSPESIIATARRVDAFLNDEVIKEAMADTEKRFIEEMIAADTSEKRAAAQGKIRALRGFALELRIMWDAGERATLEIAKAAKQTERKPV